MDRESKRRQNLEPLVRQRFRKYQEDETLRRLQWLIGLIQKPDEEFQKHKSQDRDLSDRLAIFCGSAPEAFKALRTAGIVALVHEVRAMVKAWRDGKPWTVTTTVGLQLIPKGSRAARYKDDLAGAVLSSARDLIAAEGHRIKECAADDCTTLFVRRKGGAYCSVKCSQKIRSARYYEKHHDELNEARREAYRNASRPSDWTERPTKGQAGRRSK